MSDSTAPPEYLKTLSRYKLSLDKPYPLVYHSYVVLWAIAKR